jgi:hypothetical protein
MNNELRRLYIISGIPGTGKTSLANLIADGHDREGDHVCHVEADDFHINEEGEYEWRAENVKKSHEWCQQVVQSALAADTPVVIVSNTFCTNWSIEPYEEMAQLWKYEVVRIEMDYNNHWSPSQLSLRNVHNVPVETIAKMQSQIMKRRYSIDNERMV